MARVLVLGVVVSLGLLACARPPPIECETAGDCPADKACKEGDCVPLSEVNGEGEGEGEGDVIAAVCSKVQTCGLGSDAASCIQQLNAQNSELRSRGVSICSAAADANEAAWGCIASASCTDLQNGTFNETCSDLLNTASDLNNQCNGGEGEGEGEGDFQCVEAEAFGPGNSPSFFFGFIDVLYDATQQEKCPADTFAVGMVLEWDIEDPTAADTLFATFDGGELFQAVEVRSEDTFTFSAVVCALEPGLPIIAVQLSGPEFVSTPACSDIRP